MKTTCCTCGVFDRETYYDSSTKKLYCKSCGLPIYTNTKEEDLYGKGEGEVAVEILKKAELREKIIELLRLNFDKFYNKRNTYGKGVTQAKCEIMADLILALLVK